MINEGSAGDDMWPDGWTVVTKDGKRSAQFEHTMIVTQTGVELLTARVGTGREAMCAWDEAYAQRPLAAVEGAAGGAAAAPAAASAAVPAAASAAVPAAAAAAGGGGGGSQ
jgi:hypothetical protein